jgi:hypothetical protein
MSNIRYSKQSIIAGVLLICSGVGLLISKSFFAFGIMPILIGLQLLFNASNISKSKLSIIPGVLLICLGVGLLISKKYQAGILAIVIGSALLFEATNTKQHNTLYVLGLVFFGLVIFSLGLYKGLLYVKLKDLNPSEILWDILLPLGAMFIGLRLIHYAFFNINKRE